MVEGSSDDVIGTTTGASQKFEYCGKSSIFVSIIQKVKPSSILDSLQ